MANVSAASMNAPVVYSNNHKLHSTMTMSDVTSQTFGSEKDKNKAIVLFNKADKNNDGTLSESEIKEYDSDCKKQKWKTIALIAGGVLAVAGIGFAIYKGFQINKALKQAQSAVAETQVALAKTGETLTQTEGVLAETEGALTEARQALGFGQGTIKTGDAVLEKAIMAETKGGKATFQLAEGTEKFPDLWKGTGTMSDYAPRRGDIIMGYGNAEASWGIKNPEVLREMKAKGLSVYPDHAVSSDVDIMYQTYVGQNGRDFVAKPLQFGEVVPAQKKIFPAGVAFADAGTTVVTQEAATGSASAARVGVGQFIQRGVKGEPYVKDVNDMIKRLNPNTEESKTIFARIKEFIEKRKGIQASAMSQTTQDSAIARAWEQTLKDIEKLRS